LQIGDGTNVSQPVRYDAISGDTATLASGGTGTVTASSGTIENGDYSVIGTWTGGTWLSTSGVVNVGSTAFAAGIPSPISAFSALSGKRGSYALNGATPVFSSISGNGVLLPSSKIDVDFNSAGANADINLNISMSAQIFYNLRGSVISSGAGLNGELAVTGTGCTAQPVTCGSGSVGGSFVGKNAEKALLSFVAFSQASGVFGGAASFLRVP
jgi:hypothetical protein